MDPEVLGGLDVAERATTLPIRLGSTTAERACRVLEQQLGAVWAAVLESHGLDPADGWRVSLEGLAVVPGTPEPPVNGRTPDAEP